MITFGATSWSQAIENLLTEKDKGQPLCADSAYTGEEQDDSAYTGEEQEKVYKKKKVINKVNEKGYHNKPLTKEQKAVYINRKLPTLLIEKYPPKKV